MTSPRDEESSPVRRGLEQWWPKLRVAVSVALLVLVLSQLDLARAARVLSSARLEVVALAILIVAGGRFFAALRWYILIRAMGSDAPYGRLVRLTFIGTFLHFLPAGAVALEVGRVYGLSRTTADLAGSLASVLAERVFGLLALILVALTGIAVAPPGVPRVLSGLAWVGFGLVALVSTAVMTATPRRVLDRLLAGLRLDPVRARLAKLYDRLDSMRERPKLLAWSLAAALANTSFRILPAYLVALALGVTVSLPQLFIIVPIIVFAQQIPISVAGLGVREVGWVALLGVIGVPASDSIVLSLVLVGCVLVAALPGAWLYARHGLDAPPSSNESPEAVEGREIRQGSAQETASVFRREQRS